MDKDSVILKYDQERVTRAENILEQITTSNNQQDIEIDEIQKKINQAYSLVGKKPLHDTTGLEPAEDTNNSLEETFESEDLNYNELFNQAQHYLQKRGLDVEKLDYKSLVSREELSKIVAELNRPLPRREKWIKNDFVAVFIAASIGSLTDVILSTRDNKLTGTNSSFSKWLNQFHKHIEGAPIDYQGKGFGGGYHRGLSRGHDILRFIEGILMFKDGKFIGIRYENGQAIRVISYVNQYGNPYEQLSTIEAIVRYAKHMFADLLSACSLPFPGNSFLSECSNRQLRIFAADMYKNGFNCKNIFIQSTSTIIIEIIIRVYYSIQSVKQYKDKVDISENYSNFELVNKFIKPLNKEKMYEMLLIAHSIVGAVNVGKVVIKKAPWEINISEIFSIVKYGIKVLNQTINRNSDYAKIMRNADEIHQKWNSLAVEMDYDLHTALTQENEVLII